MAEPKSCSHAHVDMNERLYKEGDKRARSSVWCRSRDWRSEQNVDIGTDINPQLARVSNVRKNSSVADNKHILASGRSKKLQRLWLQMGTI